MTTDALTIVNGLDAAEFFARAARALAVNPPHAAANGWRTSTDTMKTYGNNYFRRAVVAAGGLGANPPEDAVYPILAADADGDPLVGERDYVLRFDADQLPPAGTFWSVTMYDAEGFPAANEIGRFALGDRDPLAYNADGSLGILVRAGARAPRRPLESAAGAQGLTREEGFFGVGYDHGHSTGGRAPCSASSGRSERRRTASSER